MTPFSICLIDKLCKNFVWFANLVKKLCLLCCWLFFLLGFQIYDLLFSHVLWTKSWSRALVLSYLFILSVCSALESMDMEIWTQVEYGHVTSNFWKIILLNNWYDVPRKTQVQHIDTGTAPKLHYPILLKLL